MPSNQKYLAYFQRCETVLKLGWIRALYKIIKTAQADVICKGKVDKRAEDEREKCGSCADTPDKSV